MKSTPKAAQELMQRCCRKGGGKVTGIRAMLRTILVGLVLQDVASFAPNRHHFGHLPAATRANTPLDIFDSRYHPPFSHNRNTTPRCRSNKSRVTTKEQTEEEIAKKNRFRRAADKFRARPGTYLIIPCVAAIVGWVTNWMAVQMIFYPVKFRGIPLYIKEEVPLGFLGWQGIVPCKTRPMSEAMVNMVTDQLLSVQEAFGKLDPRRVAQLLAPEVPKLGQEVASSVLPSWIAGVPKAVFLGLDSTTKSVMGHMNFHFLKDFTIAMQENIGSLFDIRNCVVTQMLQDRTLLGQLFRKCGQKELDFLTNSGLWFGFLLGIIQMIVALFWDNPWTLSIGGLIVGYATNWLALKWIFEPVNPTKVGPFLLQGQFLRRQKEVAAEFSKFFANNVLTSEKVWNSILTDPGTTPAFHKLFTQHFTKFVKKVTRGLRMTPEPEVVGLAASEAISKLPQHVGVLHDYVDKTLGLEDTLRVRMEQMTSSQFERVLHPIFEEDELTLILAGAALGFAAGLIQQGLETGQIQLPDTKKVFKRVKDTLRHPRASAKKALQATRSRLEPVQHGIRHPGASAKACLKATQSLLKPMQEGMRTPRASAKHVVKAARSRASSFVERIRGKRKWTMTANGLEIESIEEFKPNGADVKDEQSELADSTNKEESIDE